MRQIIRNFSEVFGEFSGLKAKDWAEVTEQHYIETKDGIRQAIGWATMSAVQRGDHEAAKLEAKIFLYDLANPEQSTHEVSIRQQAAQELLDEIYASADSTLN